MFNVYTTFSPADYRLYGSRFIDTFLRYWPHNIKLYIYYEGQPEVINDRVIWVDFNKECYEQREFVKRGLSIKQDSFYRGAARFSYKAFTIIKHLEKNLDRYNIWLDADCITVKDVNIDWLYTLKSGISCVSVLMRNTRAIESGFILTDNQHPEYNTFLSNYANIYRSDEIYRLPEWHDGYILTYVIKRFKIPYFDLSPNNEYKEIHPFSAGVLGQYLDHLKGPRKTDSGSKERSIFWR
jgi:hypothetical protein